MASQTMIQCIHCKHGTFMQWMKNPVICQCDITHERFVAEAKRLCPTYEYTRNEPHITHYKNYNDELEDETKK